MIQKPMDVLTVHPVRKGRQKKQSFLDDVCVYVKTLGYDAHIEKGSFGARNLVIGDPDKAKYLLTAHYDTCARLPFPNLITPCNFWPFLGYQLLLTAAIFAFPAAGGAVVYLLTRDSGLAYGAGYVLIWLILAMMLVGPANRHNANDNTSGVVTLLEMVRSMPQNQRSKVCFVLFDLEEAGLIGSSSYQSRHKNTTKQQIILNLDCVGDGDEILFFPTGKLRKDGNKMDKLRSICGSWGRKTISLVEKGFSFYPSDQGNFPYGVGIAAMRRSRRGILYCSRIHTPRDTVLDETNVNILRAGLITLISGPAAE